MRSLKDDSCLLASVIYAPLQALAGALDISAADGERVVHEINR